MKQVIKVIAFIIISGIVVGVTVGLLAAYLVRLP